ncbi:hypothetical protein PI125_g11845 [Phytophthora idaei]|nr:hypothetical protein PI125_g11845 [Phytophthora idaei]
MSWRQGRSEAATLGSDFQKVVMSIVNVVTLQLSSRREVLCVSGSNCFDDSDSSSKSSSVVGNDSLLEQR